MTLTISVLLLIWHLRKKESPPFMLAFYFLLPLLGYFDISQIPLVAKNANLAQVWYLCSASILAGIGMAIDTYFLKKKSLNYIKEGLFFFGITSLYSPLAFLFAVALMILSKNWFLYHKRSNHPRNASWILLISLLVSYQVLTESRGELDSIFLQAFFGLLTLVLFAGFSFQFFLAALGINIMLLPTGVWPLYVHHAASGVLLACVFLASSEFAREKLFARFEKYYFLRKFAFYIFKTNNPPLLIRSKRGRSHPGAAVRSSGKKTRRPEISFAEPGENIFWQSNLTMFFLLLGLVVLGAIGGLYN